ncbi:MAG TPA: glycosyltransferase family 39 protein, partial [Anaerolineales bacterium]|nr:glycosyltransferase family 39 protein [Anaerolineales bacterium]
MQTIKTFLTTHSTLLSRLAALAGVIVYTLQSWYYIHHLDSVLDEGAYLTKGLLFVRGVYTPFQDYGPLTNHTPLGFLIPGVIQVLFGPGLRPARYFALFVGLLILLGLWVLVRRLRGEGWAAFAVWALALNVAVIKMYSVATSQVLIACMLVWMLVCILGDDRKPWQLAVGGALAGIAMMTRINLAAVLPIIVLYIWWQYNFRAALLAAGTGGVVVLIGHLAYWPDILKLWTYWLPDSLTPFLDPWREPEAVRYWNPDTDFNGRV